MWKKCETHWKINNNINWGCTRIKIWKKCAYKKCKSFSCVERKGAKDAYWICKWYFRVRAWNAGNENRNPNDQKETVRKGEGRSRGSVIVTAYTTQPNPMPISFSAPSPFALCGQKAAGVKSVWPVCARECCVCVCVSVSVRLSCFDCQLFPYTRRRPWPFRWLSCLL